MKVDIITMHCPLNYGAVLQTYALQSYIEDLGHSVEVIDYRPKYLIHSQKLFYIGNKRAKSNPLFAAVYIVLKLLQRIKIKRNFNQFIQKYLKLSDIRYNTYEELVKNPVKADVYICGSDQIWNTALPNGSDDAYFLSFVQKGSKNAYAASLAISTELDTKHKERFKRLLSDFSAISVREDAAISLLSFLGKDIAQVLDPVFLLSKEEWIARFNLQRTTIFHPYILIYPMGDGQNVLCQAKRLACKTGLPIFSISQSRKREGYVTKTFSDIDPIEFVDLVLHAEYVVTNSFHGTAFSIIFKKNFWACNIANTSSRIESLLRCTGLTNRLIEDSDSTIDLLAAPDYATLDEKQQDLTHFSKHFLENIFKQS